jgi:hypothetical protein
MPVMCGSLPAAAVPCAVDRDEIPRGPMIEERTPKVNKIVINRREVYSARMSVTDATGAPLVISAGDT